MRIFNSEVCGGTCVFGFMIEKNAMQPMPPKPGRLPRNSAILTLARVVDLEVAVPVVEGENRPVAAVREPGDVVSRVDLVLVRVDSGEFLSKHVNFPLEEFADLVRWPDGAARQVRAI